MLHNKYRFSSISQIIGNDVIKSVIIDRIKDNNFPSSIIISGFYGTGKTSLARLIINLLNIPLEDLKNKDILNLDLYNLKYINSPDHLEVDAGDTTGVDEIRKIKDYSAYMPRYNNYRTFILDESQQLSKSSWSVLLKTTEESIKSSKFIFCTSDLEKMPISIKSRSLIFNLDRPSVIEVQEYLNSIDL